MSKELTSFCYLLINYTVVGAAFKPLNVVQDF